MHHDTVWPRAPRKTVTVTWKPSGKGTHTVTGVVDPPNTVAESDEADNKPQQTVTR